MKRLRLSIAPLAAALAALAVPKLVVADTPAGAGHGPAAVAQLDRLNALDRRVHEVAFRLASANAELCPGAAPHPGLMLHSVAQYGPRLRAAARARLGSDDRPAVLAVAAGSAAESAGLRPGDLLVAVEGRELAPTGSDADSPQKGGSYAEIALARALLAEALADGQADVTVQREGVRSQARLSATPACDFNVEVVPSRRKGAAADGKNIFITPHLVDYLTSQDELALILGHEFGHNILRRRRAISGQTERIVGVREELAADRLGLYLARRAGYDIELAEQFWRRFGEDHRLSSLLSFSHPRPRQRLSHLATARAEILAKEQRRQALIP